jgi:hypothetical protein
LEVTEVMHATKRALLTGSRPGNPDQYIYMSAAEAPRRLLPG